MDRPDVNRSAAGRVIPAQKQDTLASEGSIAGIDSLFDVANTVKAKTYHPLHDNHIKIIFMGVLLDVCNTINDMSLRGVFFLHTLGVDRPIFFSPKNFHVLLSIACTADKQHL